MNTGHQQQAATHRDVKNRLGWQLKGASVQVFPTGMLASAALSALGGGIKNVVQQ